MVGTRRAPIQRRRSARRALARLHTLPTPATLRATADDTGETRRRKRRAVHALWMVTVAIALVVALVVWVFPTRTWLSQRDATNATEQKLSVLDQQIAGIEQQITALQTPEEIERVARERYDLIRPGEQAFVVLPPSVPELPSHFGYNVVHALLTVRR